MSEFTYIHAHIHMRKVISMDELSEAQNKFMGLKNSSKKDEELIDAYEWLFTKVDQGKILVGNC